MRILITGGCGFLGHHFVDHFLRNTDWEIVILDRLSYASNGFDRLRDSNLFNESRVSVFTADFTKPIVDGLADELKGPDGKIDYIIHAGAETHVDRSIVDPRPFIYSNVVGTMEVLEFARTLGSSLKRFVYISTDEVFGPSLNGYAFKEWDRYNSSTPYSASKAGGEELAIAYGNTFNVPVMIARIMNIFGERQHPEKFIPMTIKKIIKGETVYLHQNLGTQEYSSRCWIHSRNVADALLFLLRAGAIGEKYNIAGQKYDNYFVADQIAAILDLPYKMEAIDAKLARPGHDLHYALDCSKMKEMGWKLPLDFTSSLTRTVKWFEKNRRWLGI